jgi:hypothetical protein
MTPFKKDIEDPEADTETGTLFPKPGSPTNEILAWWGRRLLERSRKFAAQREERAHRESLTRLKQSLQALPQNGDGPALAACLYIVIACPQCSEVREALEDYPEQAEVVCPACGLECEFTALGIGLTRKPVPFHELHGGLAVDVEGKARIPWDELPRRVKKIEEDD